MNKAQFSKAYGIEERVIDSVIAVESSGNGFNVDGSLKIRFEAHLLLNKYPFMKKWFKTGSPHYLEHFFRFPSNSKEWRLVHDGNQQTEYNALLVAAFNIGYNAFDYVSIGSWQIVCGLHYKTLGFESSIALYTFASQSEEHDLMIGLRLLASNEKMLYALRSKDFVTFARLYNGSELVDLYSNRLNKEYKKRG